MSSRNFDERFPPMFQPGGEDLPEYGHPSALQFAGPQTPGPQAPPPQEAGTAPQGAPATSDPPATTPDWPWRRWLVPSAAAAAMLAAGAFTLGAQYWLPSSTEFGRTTFGGVELQPWGQIILPAAPPLLASGTGILAVLLFLASRHKAAGERPLRMAFAAAAVVVALAGWVGMFAPVAFPDAAIASLGDGTRAFVFPWTYMVGPSGAWLLAVGTLMLATLVVVPRRWQLAPMADGELPDQAAAALADAGPAAMAPSGGRPSPARGLWLGAALAAAGLCTLFVQYLAPLVTGDVIVEVFRGQVLTHQDWAFLVQALAAPLLVSGFTAIGWALVYRAATPRRGQAAEGGPSAVEAAE